MVVEKGFFKQNSFWSICGSWYYLNKGCSMKIHMKKDVNFKGESKGNSMEKGPLLNSAW